jgi:hypothetical protein
MVTNANLFKKIINVLVVAEVEDMKIKTRYYVFRVRRGPKMGVYELFLPFL